MSTLSLTAAPVDIEVEQGSDSAIEFQLTKNGDAIDISNDDVSFTAKDAYGGTTTIATKTNGTGEHSIPGQGKTIFILTKEDTTVIGQEGYTVTWYYEVRRWDPDSELDIVHMKGKLVLKPMVGTSA